MIDADARSFEEAEVHIQVAVAHLKMVRRSYWTSDLPADIRLARVAALDAKIDALRAVYLDPRSHPWCEDA